MASALGEMICAKLEVLQGNKKNHELTVQEIFDFVDPTNGLVIRSESPGELRHSEIYDPTAGNAFGVFVSGMYGNITPPGEKWISLSSSFQDLKKDHESIQWFNQASLITHSEFAKSNFSMEIQEVFQDLGIPGRSTIIVLPHPSGSGLQFKTIPWAQSWIAEDHMGIVDSFYRLYQLTATQAFSKWPGKVSKKIRDSANDKRKFNDKFWFIHACFPRMDRNVSKGDKINMPFANIQVEKDSKQEVEVGGFKEKPFASPRFYKDSNEVEGRSPGWKALHEIILLNDMVYTLTDKANWDARPPIMFPHDDIMNKDIAPGGRFSFDPGEYNMVPQFLVSQGRYDLPQWLYEKKETAVRKEYFQDFFNLLGTLPPNVEKTAFEINELINEKVDLLSLMRGRQTVELLDPVVTRAVNILSRQGKFPPMPESLRERSDFDIEYRGRLAVLAKSLNLRSVNRYLEFMEPIFERFPEVRDRVDPDELAELGADVLAIPSEILRDRKIVQEERAARQQKEENESQAMIASELAKSVPSLQKQTEENSPLSILGAA